MQTCDWDTLRPMQHTMPSQCHIWRVIHEIKTQLPVSRFEFANRFVIKSVNNLKTIRNKSVNQSENGYGCTLTLRSGDRPVAR